MFSRLFDVVGGVRGWKHLFVTTNDTRPSQNQETAELLRIKSNNLPVNRNHSDLKRMYLLKHSVKGIF
jgi:hypothetical protein